MFRTYLFRISAIVVSCTLIGAFGVHSMEVEHEHPGHVHAGHEDSTSLFSLGEYVHAAEKKFLLALSSTFSLLSLLYLWTKHRERFLLVPRFARLCSVLPKRTSYDDAVQICFSDGILNPKLYG